MPRRRKDCPICGKRNLVKLSNHLADMHHLSCEDRQQYLVQVRSRGDESGSDCEEMPSRKRMRKESDDEMSTVSNEDTFSSSDEEDGESSEEKNDSDDSKEADPWGVLIHEAASKLRTKYYELVQSFQHDGFTKINAKKQAFSEILPKLRKELENVYLERLLWMWQMKRDPMLKKIMEAKKRFMEDDFFDTDEALAAAIKKRKFLLERMLEDR